VKLVLLRWHDKGSSVVDDVIASVIYEQELWDLVLVEQLKIDDYRIQLWSKFEEDRKDLPGLLVRAGRYGASLARRAMLGAKRVTDGELDRRLKMCATCEHRSGNKCSICGCYLINGVLNDGKALWQDEHCPIEKW
jgi:hypothetical protein